LCVLPSQTGLVPEITPGNPGMLVVTTANVRVGLFPQVFPADTLMVPLEADAVASMDSDVEIPVQPPGSTHE